MNLLKCNCLIVVKYLTIIQDHAFLKQKTKCQPLACCETQTYSGELVSTCPLFPLLPQALLSLCFQHPARLSQAEFLFSRRRTTLLHEQVVLALNHWFIHSCKQCWRCNQTERCMLQAGPLPWSYPANPEFPISKWHQKKSMVYAELLCPLQ